jgi:hypothetical protein
MARDKLITIRIEGEKRDAFNQLAKAQNTDTASLLYDFISGCLDNRIDISLVTGKGQRIDKIDNQLDTNRLDKLEATTQRIDNRLDTIAKRLADYVEAIDDRVTDCDQVLSNKITSLEHRLNALSIQLDSQQDSQQLDRIDTDSQGEPLIKEALKLDYLNDQSLVDAIETQIEDTEIDESDYEDESDTSPLPPNQETVETDSTIELDKGAIGPVRGDSDSIDTEPSEAVDIENRQGLTNDQLSKKIGIPTSTIEKWKGKIREGKEITSTKYPKFFKQWTLNLADSLWYEIN